jgi:hypothetical protein
VPLSAAVANSLQPVVIGRRRAVAHPSSAKVLPLVVEKQARINWCWAAVAVSVRRFFDRGAAARQCDLANSILGLTTCCDDDVSGNNSQPLPPALIEMDVLRRIRQGAVTFEEVQAEIDAGRPVACYIAWSAAGGAAHFTCIAGYDAARNIMIRDPQFDSSTMPFDTFATAYQGSGSWAYTYFLKAPA